MTNAKFDLDCAPSKDKKKVTITVTSDQPFGLRELVRCLAHYIQTTMGEAGADIASAAIQQGDRRFKSGDVINCLMCAGREPTKDCHLCRGSGALEAHFKKGFASNQLETTGKLGKSGYPKVYLPFQSRSDEETARG
jgi:hypothetical protein